MVAADLGFSSLGIQLVLHSLYVLALPFLSVLKVRCILQILINADFVNRMAGNNIRHSHDWLLVCLELVLWSNVVAFILDIGILVVRNKLILVFIIR